MVLAGKLLRLRMLVGIAGAVTIAGCAVSPIPVTALPGPNKDPRAFNGDENACRHDAGLAAYPAASSGRSAPSGNVNVDWNAFFVAYAQCEKARGNLLQPVPWAVAYAVYLGYGAPYPYAFATPYPYPYP